MDQVLYGLPFMYSYLDDMLVASHNAAQHLEHLRQVFTCLQDHGLQIHPSKCIFGVASLSFLGFQVAQHSIHPMDDKVQVIKDFTLRHNVS